MILHARLRLSYIQIYASVSENSADSLKMATWQHLQTKLAIMLSPKQSEATQSQLSSRTNPSSVADQVFGVFELVENILLQVITADQANDFFTIRERAQELRALYRLQRLNTTTRDVAARSKELRIAMFKEFTSGG